MKKPRNPKAGGFPAPLDRRFITMHATTANTAGDSVADAADPGDLETFEVDGWDAESVARREEFDMIEFDRRIDP